MVRRGWEDVQGGEFWKPHGKGYPRAWPGEEKGVAEGGRPEGSHSELTRVWETRQRGRGKRGEECRSDRSVCVCVC